MSSAEKLVVFRLDDTLHALRLENVLRVVRAVQLTALPDAPATVAGVVNVQGEVLPVIDTRRRFGLGAKALEPSDRLILASLDTRRAALLVDAVEGVLSPEAGSVTPAERVVPSMELTEGALRLEDGMILIYNLERFLSLDDRRQLEQALERLSRDG
ncbi:chemotaxis protein CheW [bacterium]|nr:chemotaxis protein CheW [bacterium]